MIAAQVFFENVLLQARRNREGWGGCSPPQIFVKIDLLPIENNSDKKWQKNINHLEFLENYW